jgi:hypothetical protein
MADGLRGHDKQQDDLRDAPPNSDDKVRKANEEAARQPQSPGQPAAGE